MECIPITLKGNNLGTRHQHLNNLVNEAFKHNIPFESIKDAPEQSPIDRLYKIDLAAKYKNVDYILDNLKNEDMLYVSRAMKSQWLITDNTYANIINPAYLEDNLYPEMRTNAVNKMKHWIRLNLKDEVRCQQFYNFYKNVNLDYAIKYLPKCSINFFLQEMGTLKPEKITPQFLKLLCERSTKAADLYLTQNSNFGETLYYKGVLKKELKQEENTYITSVKTFLKKLVILLKIDPNIYFYLIENFFYDGFPRLNKRITTYIMKHHKDRFNEKAEFYTARVLDMKTIAKYLSGDEIKDLIIKLVKANYLGKNFNFNYEFAKPLVKTLDPKQRTEFCSKIFKDKQFGEAISDAPYLIPSKPNFKNFYDTYIFEREDNYGKILAGPLPLSEFIQNCSAKRKFDNFCYKSDLDILYDEYRFKSFEKTFFELRQRIRKESKKDMRQNMILVLVSKTGGRSESVEELFRYLLTNHSNEPVNLRAAIVRSLVKRAFAWRLPEYIWKLTLEFGHDLGLDGKSSGIECMEGLHAIILRHILFGEDLPAEIWNTYLKKITPLLEYKLNTSEKVILYKRLPALIIASANKDMANILTLLLQVCDIIEAYRISLKTYPDLLNAIATSTRRDLSSSKELLMRVFKARVGRKLLFKENFEVIRTNASFMNALRHDATIISTDHFHDLLKNINTLNHNQFLRKVALYFGEDGGLARQLLNIIVNKAHEQPHIKLARPITLLANRNSLMAAEILNINSSGDINSKRMVSTYKSCIFVDNGKLPLNLKAISLSALANWVHTASTKAFKKKMDELIQDPRQARLVMTLRGPHWPGLVSKTLPNAAKTRSTIALRTAFRILAQYPHVYLRQDLGALKNLVSTINFRRKNNKYYSEIVSLHKIPYSFRLEYAIALYQSLTKQGFETHSESESTVGPTYRIAKVLIVCMKNHLNEIDRDVITGIIKELISKELTLDIATKFGCEGKKEYSRDWDYEKYVESIMALIAEYLIMGRSDQDLHYRLNEVYSPLERKIRELWHIEKMNSPYGLFVTFIKELQKSKVFLNANDFSLPVLEKVRLLSEELFPMCEDFTLYYRVSFIKLFRQTLKQCAVEKPDLCKTITVDDYEGTKYLMLSFAKLVANDLEIVVANHFPSIRTIYLKSLKGYLESNFLLGWRYFEFIITALLTDESKPNAVIVGLNLCNEIYGYSGIQFKDKTAQKEVIERMNNFSSFEFRCFAKHSTLCA